LYELHVGAFSPEGQFDGVLRRLDDLAALGITAVELMPVADFPGARNWGYDGVLPFAPDRRYGSPDDLKRLVDAAHQRELMVILDVVYNHFGPEGNYLHLTAPGFFTTEYPTPWGAAIDFSQPTVRAFFVHNALYWLEEFGFDGLRFDACHAIFDATPRHILDEIADAVASRFIGERLVHLTMENERNQTRFLVRQPGFAAQWNDDSHHAYHTLLTGEQTGYYIDYPSESAAALARGLAEGFVYQGDASRFRGGAGRGEPSAGLSAAAFIDFLQNHDQIGYRLGGERLSQLVAAPALEAATAVLLLAPHIPLLFMGQEWNCQQPFLFFCDFSGELAAAVRDGRRRELAAAVGGDEDAAARAPDPTAAETFAASCLDWAAAAEPEARRWCEMVRTLLTIRAAIVTPLLPGLCPGGGLVTMTPGSRAFQVAWRHVSGAHLVVTANLGPTAAANPGPQPETPEPQPETIIPFHCWPPSEPSRSSAAELPPWSVAWALIPAPAPAPTPTPSQAGGPV
jgi:malto-oligosyltrehalose trehalohydrolase